MENSNIGWTHHTANLWWGCTEKPHQKGIHPGCVNCYARDFDQRYQGDHWGARKPRRYIKSTLAEILKWEKQAHKENTFRRVFTGSMMDLFERARPLVDLQGEPGSEYAHTGQLREHYLKHVIPATPHLLHLLLTKRPENILRMIPEAWKTNPPHNVMYGYSVSDQETAAFGLPYLLQVPGYHFLSIEPLLGEVDLRKYGCPETSWDGPYSYLCGLGGDGNVCGVHGEFSRKLKDGIDWVITGGESGRKRRVMNLKHMFSIVTQCEEAGVPVYVKQDSALKPGMQGRIPDELWKKKEFPAWAPI